MKSFFTRLEAGRREKQRIFPRPRMSSWRMKMKFFYRPRQIFRGLSPLSSSHATSKKDQNATKKTFFPPLRALLDVCRLFYANYTTQRTPEIVFPSWTNFWAAWARVCVGVVSKPPSLLWDVCLRRDTHFEAIFGEHSLTIRRICGRIRWFIESIDLSFVLSWSYELIFSY